MTLKRIYNYIYRIYYIFLWEIHIVHIYTFTSEICPVHDIMNEAFKY